MEKEKGFIFDLDGTIYLDNKLISGAAEAIKKLKDRGDKVVFLTNKSIEGISHYVKKLNRLGINASSKEVINSNLLTAKYLKNRLKIMKKSWLLGRSLF